MRIMNSRRLLISSVVLSCLFLGASAFAQDRPVTHTGRSSSKGITGGSVRPNPEPFSLALLGLGGAGLVYSVKRRRRQDKSKA